MRKARGRACALLILMAALCLGAPPAHAEGLTTSPEQRAAFENGLAQYRMANYAGAIATWEGLLTTMGEETGYKVLYNLGLAYEAIDDITKAIEDYRAFEVHIAGLPDPAKDALARAEEARSRRHQLEEANGAVEVRASRRGGLVLTRVGSSAPRAAGYVAWLAPGWHTVELSVGTEQARMVTVEVERGKTVVVDATPPEVAHAASPADEGEPVPLAVPRRIDLAGNGALPEREPPPPPSSPQKWLLLGAAVEPVALALPVSLYFVARDKRIDATALGTGNPAYADARSTYNGWRTATYASYALPMAIAAVTLGLAFWPRPRAPLTGRTVLPSLLQSGSLAVDF